MENQKESYDKARAAAKKFYKTIGSVWCPVLDDCIAFNKRGFRHLIGKNGFTRPKNEQMRRFTLLVHARDILENPKATSSQSTKKIRKLKANFWTFRATINGIHIKIVIRQIGRGKKHFLSIYGKIQKSTP